MRIGLVINPWAGVGGSVALKGSDGTATREKAIALGAQQRSVAKTKLMFQSFQENNLSHGNVQWFCGPGDMGAIIFKGNKNHPEVYPDEIDCQTEAEHTIAVATWLIDQQVDLIVFAGGDGTARDLYSIVESSIPVLGIPAGVKIHSGVFAVTPHAAGEVLAGLVDGRITQIQVEEVRDIDEEAFRNNQVRSRYFGEMKIPLSGEFMQHVKVGGIESEPLVLSDIADWLDENMDPEICYFVGSGKTLSTLMEHLNLDNTLLGVDAVLNGEVIKQDCTENDLLQFLSVHSCHAILSIIGGQGHIFGRGNAQFSQQVISQLSKKDVTIVGSKAKLKSLEGRPLIVDSSDVELDKQWSGLIEVLTGYNDKILYQVAAL